MKSFFELHGDDTNKAYWTDCTNTSGWTPSEYFVNLVLEGIQNYGDLSGKATQVGVDLAAGNGDTVNIRYSTPRTHSCTSTACGDCLSAVSTSFDNYPCAVFQYGDYDKIVGYADWMARGDIVAEVADLMSMRMAHCRDLLIWQKLCSGTYTYTADPKISWTATPVYDTTCCSFTFDLYNKIVDARASLEGRGYKPSHILIHPYVAKYFYYKEGNNTPNYVDFNPMVKYDTDGHLIEILGLKVIEVGVAVDDDATPTAGDDELAFVIDSRRAIAEAWGMKPKFWQFYDGVCNATEVTLWQYWGTELLDTNAIVELANP